MVKSIVRDILIVLGITLMVISTSRTAMEFISNNRDDSRWWGTYQCSNGDLVSMSYLDNTHFRRIRDNNFPKPTYTGPKNTNVYLTGDSYTRGVRDTLLAGVCNFYHHSRYKNNLYYKLDKTKKNLLFIEITERDVRDYFNEIRITEEIADSSKLQGKTTKVSAYNATTHYAALPSLSIDDLFNKYINQNLQCNLFNYNFFMPVFETKAALNYVFFSRASGDVVISKDKKFLFLKETVMPEGTHSSYSKLTQEEVNHLADNLNKVYDHFKAEGFTEVYLSVIPNTATIMQPEGYNNLIPLLYGNPQLRMKIIDVYSIFKKDPEGNYFNSGDTHWNKKGFLVWLGMVNSIIIDADSGNN